MRFVRIAARLSGIAVAALSFVLFLAIMSGMVAGVASKQSRSQSLNVSVTPVVSSTGEKGHVLKATPGHLYAAYATNLTTTAGFLVILDATSVPSDGAILPVACIPLPASGAASFNYAPTPPGQFSTGITAAVTSASTCFTLTTGTITAFISGLVQ